ncbi:MAG: DUF1553 domain-containing protein, partial [Planctomycetota bacterium]|nr:DUF1553 domain-containing protein [Planctomycetota bacterium]
TKAEGPVHSGKRAIKRTAKGLAQDVYEGGQGQVIPPNGKLFLHVWIDPKDPPKGLMLQLNKNGWDHRAVWGDDQAFEWGKANTHSRMLVGPLPEANKWVRLEVPIEKIGLVPGDHLAGFALTQVDGTVYWDEVGVVGVTDPDLNSSRSFLLWLQENSGKKVDGIKPDLQKALEAHPKTKMSGDHMAELLRHYLQEICIDTSPKLKPLDDLANQMRKLRNQLDNSMPRTFVYNDLKDPRETFVMLRGQYTIKGERVYPGVPAFLPPLPERPADKRANRLDLANWLVSNEHPLTARVAVNRFWQQFFSIGLVETSSDFGVQGTPPSHPELLDWLAVDFRESGWDVKRLVRQIVVSATFRQASNLRPGLSEEDPHNRLLARGPRFRLDAEQIRDNALFVSGLMDLKMGGRGVNPYQPPNIWEPVGFVGSNTAKYTQGHGTSLYRRSVYTFFKRTAPPPFMVNFDAPSREASCSRRIRSNTPLQALQLMNDVQHFEAGRQLATRMINSGGPTGEERIRFAYKLLVAREPSKDELAIVQDYLQQNLTRFEKDPEAAGKVIRHGESTVDAKLSETELAAYTLVANLLFNMDETLNRN